LAKRFQAGFLNKYSDSLLIDLKEYIVNNFGFGPFYFIQSQYRRKNLLPQNLKEFQETILRIPDETLEYHSGKMTFQNG
jgi:hypothetical protein